MTGFVAQSKYSSKLTLFQSHPNEFEKPGRKPDVPNSVSTIKIKKEEALVSNYVESELP